MAWHIEHVGNGWDDWFNFTCPRCGKKYEKVPDYREWYHCPKCGEKNMDSADVDRLISENY